MASSVAPLPAPVRTRDQGVETTSLDSSASEIDATVTRANAGSQTGSAEGSTFVTARAQATNTGSLYTTAEESGLPQSTLALGCPRGPLVPAVPDERIRCWPVCLPRQPEAVEKADLQKVRQRKSSPLNNFASQRPSQRPCRRSWRPCWLVGIRHRPGPACTVSPRKGPSTGGYWGCADTYNALKQMPHLTTRPGAL